jgi:hypothetical protein
MLAALALLSTGCLAPRLPPISLKSDGWSFREIPAVWQRSSRAPEIAGELLVAVHSDGTRYLQFSKGGLPILSARASRDGWSLQSSFRKGASGGRGRPPASILWFQVPLVPLGNLPALKPPWVLTAVDAERWVLHHTRTGERLEGLGMP